MSNKEYNPNIHSAASVPCENGNEVFQIVHTTGDRIWLYVSYADKFSIPFIQVGDGTNDGYSFDGSRIISIAISDVILFCSEEEVYDMNHMQKIDQQIMGWAR